jgi:hypothetical protein
MPDDRITLATPAPRALGEHLPGRAPVHRAADAGMKRCDNGVTEGRDGT